MRVYEFIADAIGFVLLAVGIVALIYVMGGAV